MESLACCTHALALDRPDAPCILSLPFFVMAHWVLKEQHRTCLFPTKCRDAHRDSDTP